MRVGHALAHAAVVDSIVTTGVRVTLFGGWTNIISGSLTSRALDVRDGSGLIAIGRSRHHHHLLVRSHLRRKHDRVRVPRVPS